MRAIVERSAILDLIARARHIAPNRSTLPILTCIRIVAQSDHTLAVTATDAMCWYTETANAGIEVQRVGAAVIPAADIHALIRGLPDESQVTLEMQPDHRLRISCGRSRYHLPTLHASDMPPPPDVDKAAALRVSGPELKTALSATLPAASTEDTRPYLCGVYIHRGPKGLNVVATDGHRLARRGVAAEAASKRTEFAPLILPTATVNHVMRLVGEGSVTLHLADAIAAIEAGAWRLTSKLVDGTYPDYERIIPTGDPAGTLMIDRQALAEAAERVALAADADRQGQRSVFLVVRPRELAVVSYAGTGAEAVEYIECEHTLPTGYAPRVSTRYLRDILNHLPGDTVRAEMRDQLDPLVWRDGADSVDLAMVMPIRDIPDKALAIAGADQEHANG